MKAPWTKQQVEKLQKYQNDKSNHPYTCVNCSEQNENTILIPNCDGWYCPRCDLVVQDWAHSEDIV